MYKNIVDAYAQNRQWTMVNSQHRRKQAYARMYVAAYYFFTTEKREGQKDY